MNQIKKVSSYLLTTFNVLLIALPLCIVIQWLFIDTSMLKNLLAEGIIGRPIQTPEGCVNLSTIHWTTLSKNIGLSADIFGLIPLFLSLFVLKSIFRNYQKGEIFTITNAKHYKHLGWLFFFDALLVKPISDLLMALAVTFSNPPGHRCLSLGFGAPSIAAIFGGILVIVISWVMIEGSKLHDDQKFTI